MEEEIWKDVIGFEGKYQVSNLGRMRTIERDVKTPHGGIKHIPQHILTLQLDVYGYYRINLMTKNNTRKKCAVHRLVAEAFIPNPNNYPIINHKDETRTNNKVTNLEWCTYQYNNTYGTVLERRSKTVSRKVEMIDRETGKIIKTFDCAKDASKVVGVSRENILEVCRNKHQTAGGYVWRFANKEIRKKYGIDDEIRLPEKIVYFGRKIEMLDKENENVLQVFNNLNEASKTTGIDISLICAVCRGRYGHHTAGGYKWRYAAVTNGIVNSETKRK